MKKAVLTMGLPASGKSSTIKKTYTMSEFTLIDPDEIKKEKSDYSDSKPTVYHAWSKKEAKERTAKAIANNENIIIDGTGTSTGKMVQKIKALKNSGYTVELLYVNVKLSTALYRNKNRARTVPENILIEKFESINESWGILSNLVDKALMIRND